MNRKNGLGIAVWLALVVATGYLAFGYGPGPIGYGPWHEDRMAPWGDEAGVFGGYGMGPGMPAGWDAARGGNMPHGMMMGRGGMGPQNMGFAMMGSMPLMGLPAQIDPARLPGLDAEQTQKIRQLQREANARNSQLAQQAWTAQDTLNRLSMSGQRDWDAIRTASEAVLASQRLLIDSNIDLQKKIDGLLTDRQREERARNGWGYEPMGVQ